MKPSWKRSSRCCGRSGITLIEVTAGLALLGTVLVAIVMAKGRYAQQWVQANHRQEAVAVADALLTQWWQNPQGFPRSGRGGAEDRAGLSWRTHLVPNKAVEELGAQVVRLEIVRSSAGQVPSVTLAVEVVLPPPEDKQAEGEPEL